MLIGLEQQLGAVRVTRVDHREPAEVACGEVVFVDEPQDLGVEGERTRLVVDVDGGDGYAGHGTTVGRSGLVGIRSGAADRIADRICPHGAAGLLTTPRVGATL